MTEDAQNLLALNIVLAIVAVITSFLMITWFRMTKRRWPNRKELLLRVGANLSVWLGCNILYLYLKFR